MIFWCLVCFVIYLSSYFTKDLVAARYIFFTALFMAIFISLAAQEAYLRLKTQPTIASKLVLYTYVVFLITGVAYQGAKTVMKYKGYRSFNEVLSNAPSATEVTGDTFLKKFAFLKRYVGEDDVVISDRVTAWTIPSFSGKTTSVMVEHFNIFITNIHQRDSDTKKFFDDEADDDFRRSILNKYGVDYLLINSEFVSRKLSDTLKSLGRVVYEDQSFTLVAIEQ